MERVRQNYLKIARERGLPVIDATKPVEEVAEELWKIVKERVKCGNLK
ncbi:MAG: hypothetical protein QW680_09215 [Pyrobaculum sp.]